MLLMANQVNPFWKLWDLLDLTSNIPHFPGGHSEKPFSSVSLSAFQGRNHWVKYTPHISPCNPS